MELVWYAFMAVVAWSVLSDFIEACGHNEASRKWRERQEQLDIEAEETVARVNKEVGRGLAAKKQKLIRKNFGY